MKSNYLTNTIKRVLPKKLIPIARRTYKSVKLRKRKMTFPEISKEQLISDFHRTEINQNDVVMVHSSLSRIGNVRGGAETVIEALMETVSPTGTLLFPSYCNAAKVFSDHKKEIYLDLRLEPSVNGKIPETFRLMPNVLRSSHPFSSVCAWGKHALMVTGSHHIDARICHIDSPIGKLYQLKGIVLGIGIDLGPVSFYHVVEDTWGEYPLSVYCPARKLTYIDFKGNSIEREVCRYNPELSKTRIDQPGSEWLRGKLYDYLVSNGILKTFKIGNSDSWLIHCDKFYSEIKHLANNGITIYTTEQMWNGKIF